ncbi:MAG: pyrroloquinoline quinone biosynthesis protein PqqE [Mycobacterium sp.]
MPAPDPLALVAELTYACPLHCPYCSNPTELSRAARKGELCTEEWDDIMAQAAALGVLQVGFSGGEPLVRRDLEQIIAAAHRNSLYTNLITGGSMLNSTRLSRLQAAGLDHVQISLQDGDPLNANRIAGANAHEQKLRAAREVRASGLALTLNVVIHRYNIDRLEAIVDLCVEFGAQRLELAHTQYYGWAAKNQSLLMPTRDQVLLADAVVGRVRRKYEDRVKITYVLSDIYQELPKPCMGGWGLKAMVIAPDGRVMPCHAADSLPGMQFANVRTRSLADIWRNSEAFERFRGDKWMREPCRTCPLERRHIDFGGCRCQAYRLTGDPRATDPVCHLSPMHAKVAVTEADTGILAYRRMTPS